MVYSMRRFVLSLALYYFVFVFFSPFSIAITSLEEELRGFHSICTCLVLSLSSSSLVSGKACGLGLWHSLDFSLTFLVHLSRMLTSEFMTSLCCHRLCSVVCRLSTFSNIFSSGTTGLIEVMWSIHVMGERKFVCGVQVT